MELQSKASHEVTNDLDGRDYSSLETLMRITFGIARLSVEGPIPRAGLRLATEGAAVRPPLKHPFMEWQDIATRKLTGAVKEADVRPDIDVEAVAKSLVSFFVGTRVVGRSLEPVAHQPRRLAEMWHLTIRGLVPVTRRARYLNLAARLEREMRVA